MENEGVFSGHQLRFAWFSTDLFSSLLDSRIFTEIWKMLVTFSDAAGWKRIYEMFITRNGENISMFIQFDEEAKPI